jgi:hypothetical protein
MTTVIRKQRGDSQDQFLRVIEILFYLYWFYLTVFPAFGLFLGDNSGAVLLVGITLPVLIKRFPQLLYSRSMIFVLLVASATLLSVGLFHGGLTSEFGELIIRILIRWLCNVFLISQLMHRQGFLERLLFFMLLVAVVLGAFSAEVSAQIRLRIPSGGAIGNANDFGAWCGFVLLGLFMYSFKAERIVFRLGYVLAALVAGFLMALTVSRASLISAVLGIALYLLIRLRENERYNQTLINIGIMVVLVVALGQTPLFAALTGRYEARWNVDSGRTDVWMASIRLLEDHPFGVGEGGVNGIYADGVMLSPHNAFLLFALVGGYVPFALMALFWLYAFFRVEKFHYMDGAVWLPALFLFSFLMVNTLNWYFMALPGMVSLIYATDYADRTVRSRVELVRSDSSHSMKEVRQQ